MEHLGHGFNLVGVVIGFLSALILSVDTIGRHRAHTIIARLRMFRRDIDKVKPGELAAPDIFLPLFVGLLISAGLLFLVPTLRVHWFGIPAAIVATLLVLSFLLWASLAAVIAVMNRLYYLHKHEQAGLVGFVLLSLAFMFQLVGELLPFYGRELVDFVQSLH